MQKGHAESAIHGTCRTSSGRGLWELGREGELGSEAREGARARVEGAREGARKGGRELGREGGRER